MAIFRTSASGTSGRLPGTRATKRIARGPGGYVGTMTEKSNLIDVLLADHQEVEAMFTEFETGTIGNDRRAELREKLITELVRHSVAEEMYLYPTARKVLPGGNELADREIEEHAAAERVMKDLEAAGPDDPRFDEP